MSINVCNNNSMSAITSLPSGVGGGSLVLISTQTASSSSAISFTSGIDSTYKEYIFKFINIHPSASAKLGVNFSDDTSSHSYNLTKTTTLFNVQHDEADSYAEIAYSGNDDLAQSTSDQPLSPGSTHTNNDDNLNGILHLFDPSNTTFVKHFMSRISHSASGAQNECYMAGYCNTTAAVTAVRFAFSSGNIDSGTIKLYGIS